jgi:hypothetical protein
LFQLHGQEFFQQEMRGERQKSRSFAHPVFKEGKEFIKQQLVKEE